MTKTAQAGTQHVRVWVNHWQNSRAVRILPDQVGLQVTVPSCSHCVTCQRRVRELVDTLARKPEVIHQWKSLEDGAAWVFLPIRNGQKPLDLLRETLEIRINRN